MTQLDTWAVKWGVPPAALADLRAVLLMVPDLAPGAAKRSEAAVQAAVRAEASRKGLRLFRNNVGALKDETGRVVRYGLANDSAQLNKLVKSADLIGIRPILITEAWLGATIGQFVSRECKAAGWRYTGTEREAAQLKWASMVAGLGGDAAFATGEGTL